MDDKKPITVKLDGVAVTAKSVTRVDTQVVVAYSQAPTVFPSKSKHTLEVAFTTSTGKQVVDQATGPFLPVSGATSPYRTTPAGEARYFRAE